MIQKLLDIDKNSSSHFGVCYIKSLNIQFSCSFNASDIQYFKPIKLDDIKMETEVFTGHLLPPRHPHRIVDGVLHPATHFISNLILLNLFKECK